MERLIRPYIQFDEVEAEIRDIFDSGIFTKGKYVEQFRESIRKYTGARYAFLTTSATTALWISLKAFGIEARDEVIVSDFSFPATANVVEDLGAVPVFADVSLDTFNMLPEELERKITPKTKAVIFVDALGNPSSLNSVKEICRRRGIPLIEDAACAFGSKVEGVPCGRIADVTCFSFHPRKLLTTGEGGAITTDDPLLAKFFEVKLNHGASMSENGGLIFEDFGYNFRLTEFQSVLGLKQVQKIDSIIKRRQAIRDAYRMRLAPLNFTAQQSDQFVHHNMQSVVFKVPVSLVRDSLIQLLKERNIESTIGTYSLSNNQFFRTKYNQVQHNSSLLEKKTLTLPCHDGVDVGAVCNALESIVREISSR